MQLNPYLMFNGRCEAAFRFYEKALGGKVETDVCRLANG
jgi:PhnB protein